MSHPLRTSHAHTHSWGEVQTYITDFFGGVHNIELTLEKAEGEETRGEGEELPLLEEAFPMAVPVPLPPVPRSTARPARRPRQVGEPLPQRVQLKVHALDAPATPMTTWAMLVGACVGASGLLAADALVRSRVPPSCKRPAAK
jgi:hypothetical protein